MCGPRRGPPSSFITGKECPWQLDRPCCGPRQTNLAAIRKKGPSKPSMVEVRQGGHVAVNDPGNQCNVQ